MHHFVVKFSKKFRLMRQGGIDTPNQNPADALSHQVWYTPTASEDQPNTAGDRRSRHLAAPLPKVRDLVVITHYRRRRTDDGSTRCERRAEQLLPAAHRSAVTD